MAGTWATPVVMLSFPFDAVHAVTGQLLRDWVKGFPDAAWGERRRSWLVRDFGTRQVAGTLAHAGFEVVIGPDGEPADVDGHAGAIAVAEATDGYVSAAVYPRLAGQGFLRGRIPATAMWRKADRAWVTGPHAVTSATGASAGWCRVDQRLTDWVAANPEPTHEMIPPLPFDATLSGLARVPVHELSCATPELASAFAATGVNTVYDLVSTMPRRYIDMTPRTLTGATVGAQTSVVGTVAKLTLPSRDLPPGKRPVTKARIVDDHGVAVFCTWFFARGLGRRIPEGTRVVVAGKLEQFTAAAGWVGHSMTNPVVEPVVANSANMIGIYPASETHQVSTWMVFEAAREAAHRISGLTDPVPAQYTTGRGRPRRADAYRMVHDPKDAAQAKAGRDRLAYDELLRLQLVVRSARAAGAAQPGTTHQPTGSLTVPYLARLPYPLTAAQTRVTAQIAADMTAPRPMARLLQGDVGSGKTVVALLAMLAAVESGKQAALMAPNEILAVQHFEDIAAAVAGLTKPDGNPVTVALGTGKVTGKNRKALHAGLADGTVDIVVGTHALIEPKIVFKDLTLVVVDEQHRFGVEQRNALRAKGLAMPDMLYASATPVPRSAVMTVFGDLDCSTLDEMPLGRQPITTVVVSRQDADIGDPAADPWVAVKAAVAQGRQAFIVTPLATSATREAASAHATAEALAARSLSGLRIGVVTGKDPVADRHATMERFAAGDLDVLVATTVVEVGVNIPNATVMVILGGERFGLAQLHQLRGRVGRGAHPGRCLIVADPRTKLAQQRMQAIETITDGFALADLDYRLRGGGDVAGAAQSGRARSLRIASITGDSELLTQAIADATEIVASDPDLRQHPGLRDEITVLLDDDAADMLRSA